jgi:hypothetical protein
MEFRPPPRGEQETSPPGMNAAAASAIVLPIKLRRETGLPDAVIFILFFYLILDLPREQSHAPGGEDFLFGCFIFKP